MTEQELLRAELWALLYFHAYENIFIGNAKSSAEKADYDIAEFDKRFPKPISNELPRN